MESAASGAGHPSSFEPVSWLRDEGLHGGGTRLQCADTAIFDRASVNVSGIHYDDRPDRRLGSASALSTIVHPRPPVAPSMHMHISYTEMRSGSGYWRMMADLNPSHPNPAHTERFRRALADASGDWFDGAAQQGDRYFHIAALDRHRGVAHFYLEQFNSGDWDADAALAKRLGNAVIAVYGDLVGETVGSGPASDSEAATQLAYHTLYFFQVLTLDRGTTSGLMVHAQNDVGILGSLPSHVDRELLSSWRGRVPDVQAPLVDALANALPSGRRVIVDVEAKVRLAQAVRAHYHANPEALDLQARGDVVPPTVANHR